MKRLIAAGCLAAAAVAGGAGSAEEVKGQAFMMPVPDAERGRELFVHKGCFVCHSVNGVGGKAGPPLDVKLRPKAIDPLDFAARMWRGALPMVDLQSTELGYQIDLTGQDIADLAAFASDPAMQEKFSLEEIPELIRGWIVEEPYELPPLGVDQQ